MRILSFEKEEEIKKIKERYVHVHPLVFNRSLERSKNMVDLFEILESIPKTLPFSWDENSRRWKKETDSMDLSSVLHD